MRTVHVAVASAMCLLLSAPCQAQTPTTNVTGFDATYRGAGVTLGLPGFGVGGVAIGGRFEQATTFLPEIGETIQALGIGVDYYHRDESSVEVAILGVSATANYHFERKNRRWDPYLGLGLGYAFARVSVDGFGDAGDVAANGFHIASRAGLRYLYSAKTAIIADVGGLIGRGFR